MKIRRSTTVVVGLVVTTLAILAFLYGAPSGRRARREALRAFRLSRNATGISPLPVVTVRLWKGSPPGLLLVEVYESGRLVVSGRGERINRQLTRDAAERMTETGTADLGDFSSSGCNTKPGGVNSALYVLIDGAWAGTICRDASADWPAGSETKRLFSEIESHIAGLFGEF